MLGNREVHDQEREDHVPDMICLESKADQVMQVF